MHIHPTYSYPNGLNEGPPSAMGGWRSAWRWLRRTLLAALLLLLALVLAWLASNWRDADAQPRPAELALPQPKLPAERNQAYTLLGLQAAADRDPAQVGRELWTAGARLTQQLLAQPGPQARAAAFAAQADAGKASFGTLLVWPAREPWVCDELETDCAALYLASGDALAQQRQAAAVLGARCDAVVDALQADKGKGFFDEPLPADWHPAALPGTGLQAMSFCARWLHSGAALAFRQGRKDETWRQMARSNQFLRTLLAGAHTLITHQVLQGLLRRHLAFVSGLAALDPAWAAQALPLTAPFGAPEQAVRRWMVAESAYGRAALKDAQATQGAAVQLPGGDPPPGWAQRALDRVSNVLTQHRIGWHPERTAQLLDQQWLALLKRVDAGLPAALDVPRPGAADDGASPLRWWRNPLGRAMVEVPAVTFQPYLRRRLDLELHREAAALALNAQRLAIAPAARAAWAQQQPASPALRERMTWTADGRTLSVRSWAAETQPISRPADQPPAARDRIHITLDRAAAP